MLIKCLHHQPIKCLHHQPIKCLHHQPIKCLHHQPIKCLHHQPIKCLHHQPIKCLHHQPIKCLHHQSIRFWGVGGQPGGAYNQVFNFDSPRPKEVMCFKDFSFLTICPEYIIRTLKVLFMQIWNCCWLL